jgi:hypothetical protein
MNSSKINNVLEYAKTLLGIPYRWHLEEDDFSEEDKFWANNSPAPSAKQIIKNNRSIVCTGLINLMRRYNGLSIPGLNGNINGKYKEFYKKYPGGTGAWFLYLYQKKRLEKIDLKKNYPNGTLLLARFKSIEEDQGHVAVICDFDCTHTKSTKTLNEQLIIHAAPCIKYKDRDKLDDHGSVFIEPFHVLNDKEKKKKKTYYTYVCLPENWLIEN